MGRQDGAEFPHREGDGSREVSVARVHGSQFPGDEDAEEGGEGRAFGAAGLDEVGDLVRGEGERGESADRDGCWWGCRHGGASPGEGVDGVVDVGFEDEEDREEEAYGKGGGFFDAREEGESRGGDDGLEKGGWRRGRDELVEGGEECGVESCCGTAVGDGVVRVERQGEFRRGL